MYGKPVHASVILVTYALRVFCPSVGHFD